MRTRLIVLAAFVAFLGLGGVAGAYFYDDSKKDQIAEGVKVNGVPIGGMTRVAGGEEALRDAARPARPPGQGHATRTARSRCRRRRRRSGSTSAARWTRRSSARRRATCSPARWRNLRNKSLNTELAAEVSYNKPSIDKLVKRVRKSLERKPVDAKVDLSKGFIDEHGSKTGLRVKYNTLAKEVEQTLLDPGNTETRQDQDDASCSPRSRPKQLAKKYPAVLIVDRGSLQADALQEPQEGQDVRDRRRPGRAGHARRPLHDPEQGRQPGLARPELRTGRATWRAR